MKRRIHLNLRVTILIGQRRDLLLLYLIVRKLLLILLPISTGGGRLDLLASVEMKSLEPGNIPLRKLRTVRPETKQLV